MGCHSPFSKIDNCDCEKTLSRLNVEGKRVVACDLSMA
jgi:hypothetical protein